MTAPAASGIPNALRVGIGAATAVLILAVIGTLDDRPLLISPFAASTALILALPHAPLSRPRTIVASYAICTVPTLALVAAGLPTTWSQTIAVGLGVLTMQLTDTMHPPAAATPLLVAATQPAIAFLLTPILLGAALLALLATLNRRLVNRTPAKPTQTPPTAGKMRSD